MLSMSCESGVLKTTVGLTACAEVMYARRLKGQYHRGMSKQTKPPSPPFQMTNGSWSFCIDRDGVSESAGPYLNEKLMRQGLAEANLVYSAGKEAI
jgi:hypothetical protein